MAIDPSYLPECKVYEANGSENLKLVGVAHFSVGASHCGTTYEGVQPTAEKIC